MATTQENIGRDKDYKPPKEQTNSDSISSERSYRKGNVGNEENQVSKGTQSTAPAPGIAEVGNTGAEIEE